MSESNGKKRITHVRSTTPNTPTPHDNDDAGAADAQANLDPAWAATPEAKKKATSLRILAGVLWTLAIIGEIAAIFWILKQSPVNTIALLCVLVGIGALAISGSLIWKKANRLDPASKKDSLRFFVQNQLGAIITTIAFLPLIVMIFLNKDMDAKQKGLAGTIGIVICAAAVALGLSFNAPSIEQYSEESNVMNRLTGQDLVYWTKSGQVFHVCANVPEVNKESKDGQIYEGTVADAHAAGKQRLTQKWESEATNYCGYTQDAVDAVKTGSTMTTPAPVSPAPATP